MQILDQILGEVVGGALVFGRPLKKRHALAKWALLGLSLSPMLGESSFAQQQLSLQESIHHLFISPRAMGMGDAFIASADDYSGLYYNPASLARLEVGQVNLSIDAAISSNFQTFSKDIKTTSQEATGASSGDQASDYLTLLQKYSGQDFGLRTGLLEGVWVRPGWGVGVIPADLTMNLVVNQVVGPAIDLKAYLDSSVTFGYGTDVKGVDGRLSWGVSGKFVNRAFASRIIEPTDLVVNHNLFSSNTFDEGYTVDGDIGVMYTPFLPSEGPLYGFRYARPTFAAVVRNVADVGFSHSLHLLNKSTTAPPEPLYRVVDLGTKFEFPKVAIFGGRAEVDMRDIGHPYFSFRKGFHAGAELDWQMTSWWKGQYEIGVNEGYPTFGASALFTIFRIDLVSYGEDIGTYDQPRENRVLMVKLNIDI